MSDFQPPPTYANPILYDKASEEFTFNPIWLKWFIDLVKGASSSGVGSVTSVSVAVPVEFSVSGSPVTTAGTITIGKSNETSNLVWAGPTAGVPAQPTFRALVTADLAAQLVTYAKIQDVTDARLLGRSAGSAGAPMELTVGTGLSLAAGSLTATGIASNSFSTFAVSGQSDVVADSTADTLTLVGSGVTITTNAGTDTITFTATPVTPAVIAALGYWSPLTNANPTAPEIVFDGATGDTISIWTAL